MQVSSKHDTIANVLSIIAKDPAKFFENAEVICVEPQRGLYGAAWVEDFTEKTPDATQLPAKPSYLLRSVFAKTDVNGGIASSITSTDNIVPIITEAITASINPQKLDKYSVARWQHIGPQGKVVTNVFNGDTTLKISAETLHLDNALVDVQTVFLPNGDADIKVLTKHGIAYTGKITAAHFTRRELPRFDKVAIGVTALLTISRQGEVVTLYGRNDGLYMNDALVDGTYEHNIAAITMDSRDNKFIYRITDGRTWGMLINKDGQISSAPIPVEDTMGPYHIISSGPVLEGYLLLNGLQPSSDGRFCTRVRKLAKLPPQLVSYSS